MVSDFLNHFLTYNNDNSNSCSFTDIFFKVPIMNGLHTELLCIQ